MISFAPRAHIGLGALCISTWSAIASAEVQMRSERWEVGIGMTAGQSSVGGIFPFQLGNSLKMEPAVVYESVSMRGEQEGDWLVLHQESWQAKLGTYYGWFLDTSTLGYFGGRVGYGRSWMEGTSSLDDPAEATSDTWSLAAVFGGEAFLSHAFSLGVEAQLTYRRYVDDTNRPEAGFPKGRGWSLRPDVMLLIRAYLWSLG